MLFTSAISFNEIKKGTRVQLKNGFFGIIYDNNINDEKRMVKIENVAYQIDRRELKAANYSGEWKSVRF